MSTARSSSIIRPLPIWAVALGSTGATTRSAPAVADGRVYVPRDGGVAVVDAIGAQKIAAE